MFLVNRVLREASFGVKSEYLGNNNTSSYVRALDLIFSICNYTYENVKKKDCFKKNLSNLINFYSARGLNSNKSNTEEPISTIECSDLNPYSENNNSLNDFTGCEEKFGFE